MAYRQAEKASAAMRGGRCDGDAGVADLDPSGPVVQRQPDAGPARRDFVGDPLERAQRQRFVRLVLQVLHAPADVVVAHQTEKRRDRPVRSVSRPTIG